MKTEKRMKIGETIRGLATAIDEILETESGRHMGFALLVFDFDNPLGIGDYISNAKREQMIKVLKEMAMRLELKQDIPPTIGSA